MPWSQCRWLCYPDVVVAMAREDMQCFKRYVKQGREGVGMLFPGIRIRVDQMKRKNWIGGEAKPLQCDRAKG